MASNNEAKKVYNEDMTNTEIAQLLRNVAAALSLKSANRFRIIAYDKAADSVEHLTSELKDIWDEGKLDEVPGIGPNIAESLDELFRKGKSTHFETVMKDLPPALFTLLLVPGLGPKKAFQLTKEFGINDPKTAVAELEKVAIGGKIAKLPGWGEGSQANVLSSIEAYKKGQIKENRMPLPFADGLAEELIHFLSKINGVSRVDKLGSLRRKVATIGDIDLAAATTEPESLLEVFVTHPKVRKIIDRGPKGATVLLSIGRQVDLRVQDPKAYGAMLQYFTGSKHHNIRLREYALRNGLSLNEHGIKNLRTSNTKVYSTEQKFYQAIGLPWIPPEIREDRGEIEVALRQAQGQSPGLPILVEKKDIRGDLHIHSNYNLQPSHDLGRSTLEELLDKSAALGYEYIGLADHNPKISLKEDEVIDIMKKRKEIYEQLWYSWSESVKKSGGTAGKRVQIFVMLEVDIDPKGKLALPEKAFDYVDAVIISLHSSFTMPKIEMTKRVLDAFSHPKAKIWGHPTGRLLGKREGADLDWEQLFEFCIKNNKALEINSWPERLDLPDLFVREAVKKGVKLVIDTDSHAADQMNGMKYGVDVARRGWAEKKDILNTLGYNEFKEWLLT